ncbi:phenoloxidase-activating enzyme-like [Photinus pyralis]|uniref:phenoloxidase-activating enzyme-like n=1 Tax=Photinus pyralis TaxID=7054 RepID=UPI00126741D1|nr:phenoloxidase-activating enzyme-like [Photinus pyralis]
MSQPIPTMNSDWISFILLITNALACDQRNCVTLSLCPPLQRYVTNPITNYTLSSVERLICGVDEEVRVCCDQMAIANLEKESKPFYKNTKTCGSQDPIYEFPWMVGFVAYGWSLCSGALLNERYVLTSASCISQKESLNLFTILLGDLNLKNNSCNQTNSASEECLQVKSLSIEEAIPHPLFNGTFNNVGLIRLNESVVFTEYIQPICLPNATSNWTAVNSMYTSGFIIHFDPKTEREKFKRNTTIILKSLDTCKEWYKRLGHTITLNELNFCSIDKDETPLAFVNTFVDHGAPVVTFHNNQWYAEGIVSLAVDVADRQRPIVHTNVSYYLDWIHSNMKD